MIGQAIVDGFLSGAIVALGAIGVTFSLAILRFANFSHGDLLAVGAYAALFLMAMTVGSGAAPDASWMRALATPLGPFSFGWALMVPVVTLMVLDLAPTRRGMASSMQSCLAASANALVAGVLAPMVMHSTLALAIASAGLMSIGLASWLWVKPRLVPALA